MVIVKDLIDFNPETAKISGSVRISVEHGIQGVISAVRQFGVPFGNQLERQLNGSCTSEGWHQIAYPGPIIHWTKKSDGSVVADVYSNDNPNGHKSQSYVGPTRNTELLLDYLKRYTVNGSSGQSQ